MYSSKVLVKGWERLCDDYLSVASDKSIWRYSRTPSDADAAQGWKLHVSATVLTANTVLEKVGPLLRGGAVLFKGPRSLYELSRLNCGLFYGYTQVGKCLTIYPQTTEEALSLASRLHELTLGIAAPKVPFDQRFTADSCVYYRYGSFKNQTMRNGDATETPAVRTPEGTLVPDHRDCQNARPEWVLDPFESEYAQKEVEAKDTPLKTSFRVFRALRQRGRGGVYHAIDLTTPKPRLCILKEGRRFGEVAWNGDDGFLRIKREKKILRRLYRAGISVPRIFSSFESGQHFYLATEFVEGVCLQALLDRLQRRLPIRRVIEYGIQIARILSCLHSSGWAWLDCKPSNLILTKFFDLRPIDFEGALPLNARFGTAWLTHTFSSPEMINGGARARASDDLYSLGVTIYHLLWGDFPSTSSSSTSKPRRNVPVGLTKTIGQLLDPDPQRRPNADVVTNSLKRLLY